MMLASSLILAAVLTFSSYTNVAGQVLHASPIALTNNLVTFQTSPNSKSTRTFSIKIFPPHEQKRIRRDLGLPPEERKTPRKRNLKEDFELRRKLLEESKNPTT